MDRKGNKVKKILDGINSEPELKGYIMFEDGWITENDKILYNKDGEVFSVLDFKDVVENTFVMDTMPHKSGWIYLKFSCVKLDKNVNIGDVFYT